MHNLEEIGAISTLPALATIPLQLSKNGHSRKLLRAIADEKSGSLSLVTYSRPKSEVSEAYRSLRTSILLSAFGAPPKVILVTSAFPSRRQDYDQREFSAGLGTARQPRPSCGC